MRVVTKMRGDKRKGGPNSNGIHRETVGVVHVRCGIRLRFITACYIRSFSFYVCMYVQHKTSKERSCILKAV